MASSFCGNCFEVIAKNDVAYCPRCGQAIATTNPSGALAIGTILNGKYIIGNLTGIGDTGFVYKACVYQTKRIVRIGEYFPQGYCRRRSNGVSVAALSGAETPFSKGMEAFLKERVLPGDVRDGSDVIGRFSENGTAYIVKTYAASDSSNKQHAQESKDTEPKPIVPSGDNPAVVLSTDGVDYTPASHVDVSLQVRNDWTATKVILLSLVTFGIYDLYFYYHVAKGLNVICDGDGKHTRGVGFYIGIGIITIGIYSLVWQYGVGERIRNNAGRYGANVTTGGGTLLACSLGGLGFSLFARWGMPIVAAIGSVVLSVLQTYYLVRAYTSLVSAYDIRLADGRPTV